MWVKICANTTLHDTRYAVDAGADAVGFVFAPSKRRVTPHQVAEITAKLPYGTEKIGVFSSDDPGEIVRIFKNAGLDTIQLHSDFEPELTQAIKRELPGVPIIHTVSWIIDGGPEASSAVEKKLQQIAMISANPRVLIDSKLGATSGGTGVRFDWTRAREVLADAAHLRVILAGGLTPENVAEAIQTLNPWGVDVASGVEQSPGRKDPLKVEHFLRNARTASPQRRAVRVAI